MLFNSLEFLIFFPIATILYFLLPHKFRWIHLLLASCIFYMFFIPVYILILFATIIIDYIAAIWIERSNGKRRRNCLIVSLVANIGVLAIFKYYNFFTSDINDLLRSFGYTVSTSAIPLLNIILPIGLSFHTFQAMSYTIEVYRGNQKVERHFGIYALYVMFYPQLVAGPIERPQNVLHQFHEKHHYSNQNLIDGLRLMLWGLFKKVVIADRVAQYVNIVYGSPGDFHYLNLIIATLLFSIQIYCDFSGYSDMALGIAKTMGFDLMVNFRRPYFASNIQEFWSRWHISLSTWFRDYLYIPLGGNRKGTVRQYLNTIIVFVVSGFWHGANWTFLVWGTIHAFFVSAYMFSTSYFKRKGLSVASFKLPSRLATFLIVSFAWIFFRAENWTDAKLIVSHLFTGFNQHAFNITVEDKTTLLESGSTTIAISVLFMILMFVVEGKLAPTLTALNKKPLLDCLFILIVLTLVIMFGAFQKTNFIYFQF